MNNTPAGKTAREISYTKRPTMYKPHLPTSVILSGALIYFNGKRAGRREFQRECLIYADFLVLYSQDIPPFVDEYLEIIGQLEILTEIGGEQ